MYVSVFSRQEKEAWIKYKYVEKRFLKKLGGAALVEAERKHRPWTVKKCQRSSGSMRRLNKTRRKYKRYEPGSVNAANLSAAAAAKFRRDSLFCPDELDSLFSYFDTGSGPRSPAGLSSDSGLGGSTDGSTDVLAFGSVVDSVTEEEEESESSSGEVEIEQEPSDSEDPRELHPGATLHPGVLLLRAARLHNLPLMAESLAHGADVHTSTEEEGKTALIQAVIGVR
ncbi:arf-GAP with coiled-coil, ANK repeat and PH domain-containing protein 3-like [Boleophthalmus pectinirostris]|uniref:arf-GAP with coiled-coil, ANK repeat and PH domain-containing protein 3-like n=1 Tax=Boleophthalmus pectinirostris TaxID=150288 RepID=UPI00242FA1FE|nr:arf-GAP with coiled-coil, ANK repeat and PH domain-containing protein 3-like [Boleophthalmus pectinirostris]